MTESEMNEATREQWRRAVDRAWKIVAARDLEIGQLKRQLEKTEEAALDMMVKASQLEGRVRMLEILAE